MPWQPCSYKPCCLHAPHTHSQVWDDELARLANFWAANCEYMRNEHRHDQSSDYDYVGENVAATGKPVTNTCTCTCIIFSQACTNIRENISDHNSLGCKRPPGLDVNQSLNAQDAFQLCWSDRKYFNFRYKKLTRKDTDHTNLVFRSMLQTFLLSFYIHNT